MTPAAKPDYAATTGAAGTPLANLLRRFIENVKAHPGEIESDEHSIMTPIDWDGLGHVIYPLATFETIVEKLQQYERQREELRHEIRVLRHDAGNPEVSGAIRAYASACASAFERIMQFDTPAKGER